MMDIEKLKAIEELCKNSTYVSTEEEFRFAQLVLEIICIKRGES